MADAPTPEQVEQIGEALANGRQIEAIKVYRDATGKGLKEAKEFIDALLPQLKARDPEKYANISTKEKSGCGSAVVMLAFIVGSVIYGVLRIAF